MSIKDRYTIREIDYRTAMDVVVRCHYAHRIAPCTHAFGLYSNETGQLVGVCVYGSPASPSLCKGICGEDEVDNIYELTRLYVDDGLEKNLESFFVGNTIKLLDKEIIVSYSDTAQGHIGIIYQASNFYYTGITAPHKEYIASAKDGHQLHGKTVGEIYGGLEGISVALDMGIAEVTARTRKHRYVYFNCNKRRKKELLEKLNYKILPYPKQSTPVPITSTENIADKKSKLRKLI